MKKKLATKPCRTKVARHKENYFQNKIRNHNKCKESHPVRTGEVRGHKFHFVERQGSAGVFECVRCDHIEVVRIRDKKGDKHI